MQEEGRQETRRIRIRTAAEPHASDVRVTRNTTTLRISCSCPAGDGPTICPHKLAVLLGQTSVLANLQDLPTLAQVQQWIRQTSFGETWQQLKDLENVLVTVNRQIHEIQMRLDALMQKGIPLRQPLPTSRQGKQ